MPLIAGYAKDTLMSSVQIHKPQGKFTASSKFFPFFPNFYLFQGDTLQDDVFQGLAAIQHLLMEPSPGALPGALWVYLQGIQDHCNAGQATEGRLILGVELLYQ